MKKEKPADRHLDVPSEANRDKHINFTALERGETDPADEETNEKENKGNWLNDDGRDNRMINKGRDKENT